MSAPVGAVVGIYYDSSTPVDVGDAVVTRTGRTYLVLTNRIQARGKHAGRQHLRCAVVDERPPEVKVHPLHWYRR